MLHLESKKDIEALKVLTNRLKTIQSLLTAEEIGVLQRTARTLETCLSKPSTPNAPRSDARHKIVALNDKERATYANAVVAQFSQTQDIRIAARMLIRNLVELIPEAESGCIYLHREETNMLKLYVAYGLNLEFGNPPKTPLSPEALSCYDAYVSGRPAILGEDALTPFFTKSILELHEDRYYIQKMVMPLSYQNQVFGFIALYHYNAHQLFRDASLLLLEKIEKSISPHLFEVRNSPLFREDKRLQDKDPMQVYHLRQLSQVENLQHRILYIKGETPYVLIRFFLKPERRPLMLRLSLKEIEADFHEDELLRINRSYLINPEKALYAERKTHPDYELLLRTDSAEIHRLPIGRSYIKTLRKKHPQWFRTSRSL